MCVYAVYDTVRCSDTVGDESTPNCVYNSAKISDTVDHDSTPKCVFAMYDTVKRSDTVGHDSTPKCVVFDVYDTVKHSGARSSMISKPLSAFFESPGCNRFNRPLCQVSSLSDIPGK